MNAIPPSPVKLKMIRRFTGHFKSDPEKVKGLRADHPAVLEGRTLFTSRITAAEDAPRLLISGMNSRKIGDRVIKGRWRGMPIFTLTLEERATCPSYCENWRTCYGNNMQWARRHRHGPELESRLYGELRQLADKHPGGFVVRLHILGDFYSPEYVRRWQHWFKLFPQIHVFGYTAWDPDSAIGAEICHLNREYAGRCVIRFSEIWRPDDKPRPWKLKAHTINRTVDTNHVLEGMICPVQTGKTDACGSCALCWSTNKSIVFMLHGNAHTGRKPKNG